MTPYDKLIFELSKTNRVGFSLGESQIDSFDVFEDLPKELKRQSETYLPEVAELDVVRHYSNVSRKNFGIETGFYPLGSCTMKYNPKINEELAALPGLRGIHPLQPLSTIQGSLHIYFETSRILSSLSGMADFSLNPFAGAQGELAGLMIMKAYHQNKGNMHKTKVIVPDSAHGTNPASATEAGFEIMKVNSNKDVKVNLKDLKP